MINTLRTQQKFLESYGPVMDFYDLFNGLRQHLEYEAKQLPYDEQRGVNRLIGLSWQMERTTVPYLGESIEHYNLRIQNKEYDKNSDLGYSGRIWFRLDRQLRGDPSHMFVGSLVHIGTGGYSTWKGPWNELGLECNKLEEGVPWNLRRDLAAYAYQCHFYVSDFPDIDQFSIMKKLSDEEMPSRINDYWEEKGTTENDRAYLQYLINYREEQFNA